MAGPEQRGAVGLVQLCKAKSRWLEAKPGCALQTSTTGSSFSFVIQLSFRVLEPRGKREEPLSIQAAVI